MLHKTSFLEGSYSYILDKFETLNGSSVNSGLVATSEFMNGVASQGRAEMC